jgi:hypothetical protein
MPYFDMANTDRYAIIGGKQVDAEKFLDRAVRLSLTEEQLTDLKLPESAFDDGPPCLQALAMSGGIPNGARNTGLFAMGVYARLKYGDDWETKLDDMHHAHVPQPLPTREVLMIVKSLGRKKYFYPCDKQPCVNNCDKAVCKTREFGIGGSGEDLDVTIGPLVKLDTVPPTWITDVDGVRIELPTEEIMSQEKFRKICVDRLNKLPNRVKPLAWEKWFKQALEKVEVVEAPDDAGMEGQFMVLLEQFCTNVAQASVKDEVLLGKPYTEEGRTYFRSGDLRKYLHQQHFGDIQTRQIWSIIKRHGAEHHKFNIKGKCVQCWSISEFDKQTSDFGVPMSGEAKF